MNFGGLKLIFFGMVSTSFGQAIKEFTIGCFTSSQEKLSWCFRTG